MIRAGQKHFPSSPDVFQNLPLLPLPKRPPLLSSEHFIPPRMAGRPRAPSAHVVRPGSVSARGLLGPYPVMQQGMGLQHMPGMQAGGGKRFPQPFLPPGVRQSLLGPAPLGTSLRNPQMGFGPGQPLHPRGHYMGGFKKTYQRKRDNGKVAAVKTNGQISKPDVKASIVETKPLASEEESQTSGSEMEPPLKKQKNPRPGKLHEKSKSEDVEQNSASTDSLVNVEHEDKKIQSIDAYEDAEQSRTAEVQGTSFKVTIQHSSESRAFSTGIEETAATIDLNGEKQKNITTGKFNCCICSVTCLDQKDFQAHMISLEHQQKLMEIQHLSNTCLATLLPKMHILQGRQREGLQHWCAICQCQFTGDLIEHRRTKKHKMAKVSSRPFCTVCERHFRTPRKFVEHMKSPEHKQHIQELREEGGPEVMEELITLDAIGCFEEDDDYEEEEENKKEEEDILLQQVTADEKNDHGVYDPETEYGTSFVVPAAGFLCKLCRKFYHYESRARETHCKSLMHYQNLQKYKAMLMLPEEVVEEKLLASSPDAVQNDNDSTTEMEQEDQKNQEAEMQHDPMTDDTPEGHLQSSLDVNQEESKTHVWVGKHRACKKSS